ncbi:MAG: glycosyltransferase family 39 protein [Alphaproteobacteria bacterium]
MTPLPYGLSEATGARLTLRGYLLLFAVALIVFLSGLTTMPPIDRDEPRYAQASKQMLETGDYLDIHFMQETRYKKPIGIYWLQSASAKIFGVPPYDDIWPYRLPSLLGAIFAVLLTAWGVGYFHGALAGLLAGAVLLSTPLLNFEARIAKTDAVLLATICLTQFILARAYIRPEALSGKLVLTFWVGQAAGILIKGPLTPLITFCTVIALWIVDRRLDWFKKLRPWRGSALCAALVAPWLIWIGISSHGVFYSEAVDHDFLGKIFAGQDRGFLPPGYHLVLFFILFSPFVWLALRGLAAVWRDRSNPTSRFILAWIIPVWLINELIFTKLPHYVLPTYPAIAWATAACLLRPASSAPLAWYWRLSNLACGAIMLGVTAGIVLMPEFVGIPIHYKSLGLCLLASVLIVMQMHWHDTRPLLALVCGICTAIFLTKAGFGLLPPSLKPILISPQAAAVYDELRPCPFSHLITSGYTDPSIVFMTGTATRFANGADYAARLLADDACAVAMIAAEQEPEFNLSLMLENIEADRLATIRGYNYNGGRWKNFAFYRLHREARFHVDE